MSWNPILDPSIPTGDQVDAIETALLLGAGDAYGLDSMNFILLPPRECYTCLLYTSDAADERSSVDLGGRRIIKKKNKESSSDYRTTQQHTTKQDITE